MIISIRPVETICLSALAIWHLAALKEFVRGRATWRDVPLALSPLIGAAIFVLSVAEVRWFAPRRERVRLHTDLRRLIDHLQASLAAGLHLRQSLERLELEPYTSDALGQSLVRLRNGLASAQSFRELLRSESEALTAAPGDARLAGALFASLSACERLGANTRTLLAAASASLEERLSLLRKLRADTAQARFQALLLCSSPVAAAMVYAVFLPKRFEFFTHSWVGGGIFSISLLLTAIGALIAWRLVEAGGRA